MHRKIIKSGLLVLVAVFIFFGFSSLIFANTYGTGAYGSGTFTVGETQLGSSAISTVYGCKDPKALNYSNFVAHDQSLCKYSDTSLAVKPDTTTTTNATTSCFLTTKTLKQKSKGPDVLCLQKHLLNLKHLLNSKELDSIFGPKTKKAVIEFQKANNLQPDGIVGPLTRAVINK